MHRLATPTRRRTSFPSGDSWCVGTLTLPPGDGPHPLVVASHGFGMTVECGLLTVADRLVEHGIGSLVFDYRGFGRSLGEPRQVLDIARQREDVRAALAHARTLPEVDGRRLALWGTSFAGGHVLAVAAEEPHLAAAIAQVPAADGRAFVRGDGVGDPAAAPTDAGADGGSLAWIRHGLGLAARSAIDTVRAAVGAAPLYVPIAGELGSHAVIAGPDARDTLSVFVPDVERFDNRVAARIVLAMVRDRPVVTAHRIVAPLLVVVARYDRIAPPVPARTAAEAAADGHVMEVDVQHMEVYQQPHLDELLAAEIEWLRPRLGLA